MLKYAIEMQFYENEKFMKLNEKCERWALCDVCWQRNWYVNEVNENHTK